MIISRYGKSHSRMNKAIDKIGFGLALGGAGAIELLASGGPCPLCIASIGGGAAPAAGGALSLIKK